jgi:hypothetical protein
MAVVLGFILFVGITTIGIIIYSIIKRKIEKDTKEQLKKEEPLAATQPVAMSVISNNDGQLTFKRTDDRQHYFIIDLPFSFSRKESRDIAYCILYNQGKEGAETAEFILKMLNQEASNKSSQ